MPINVQLQPFVALIAGILILMMPRLLSWVVGIYLIDNRYTGTRRTISTAEV
jgi:hypothetical protein